MRFRSIRTTSGRVLVPAGLARVRGGLWLYSSCKPIPVLLDRMVGRASKLSTRLLAPVAVSWEPPFGEPAWIDWLEETARAHGSSAKHYAVQLPRDERRQRMNVILFTETGSARAFAKLGRGRTSPLSESALAALALNRPPLIEVPCLLSSGKIGEWAFSLFSPVAVLPHRPARMTAELRHKIVTSFQAVLNQELKQVGPLSLIHGDFGPWNVREHDLGITVVDWEDVTHGPRAADELWHAVNTHLIAGAGTQSTSRLTRQELRPFYGNGDLEAAAEFWRGRYQRPESQEVDGTRKRPTRTIRHEEKIMAVLRELCP